MAPGTPDVEETFEFQVDGESYDVDDLTFSELREYRKLIRQLSGEDDLSIYVAEPMDRLPALVYLIRKRGNPSYTLEEASTLKIGDVLVKVPARKGRPTVARKTRA